jgi:hypothetical protein
MVSQGKCLIDASKNKKITSKNKISLKKKSPRKSPNSLKLPIGAHSTHKELKPN